MIQSNYLLDIRCDGGDVLAIHEKNLATHGRYGKQKKARNKESKKKQK